MNLLTEGVTSRLLMCDALVAVVSTFFCPECITAVWWLALYCDTLLLLAIARCYVCCVSAQNIAALILQKLRLLYRIAPYSGSLCRASLYRAFLAWLHGRVSSGQASCLPQTHGLAFFSARHLCLRPHPWGGHRAAGNRCRRDRRMRERAGFIREVKELFGLPIKHRCWRQLTPAPQPELPVVISSGESSDDEAPVPAQPGLVIVDLSRTLEDLPDQDPKPCRVTIQEAALRQAYVVL